jgi:hypothetical protein
MTRVSCPACRLRFTAASTASLTTCPECARDLEPVTSAAATLGYRLFDADAPPPALPIAVEVALPIHGSRPDEDLT